MENLDFIHDHRQNVDHDTLTEAKWSKTKNSGHLTPSPPVTTKSDDYSHYTVGTLRLTDSCLCSSSTVDGVEGVG